MVARHRACVERAIAHLRNWRILSYGYRRVTAHFGALDAVTNTKIYRTSTYAS